MHAYLAHHGYSSCGSIFRQVDLPALALTEGILSPSLAALQSASLGRFRHWALIQEKETWPHFLVEEAVRLQIVRNA